MRTAASFPAGNLKKAGERFGDCASNIYALDDIGRRFAGNPFSPITMSNVITALSEQIRAILLEADAMLPGFMVHQAHIESAEAANTLQALDDFIIGITVDNELMLAGQTGGRVIYELTARAAKAIERAQLACGVVMTATDYLSGDGTDPSGGPEESHE
jgi:hypothetical protein